MWKYKIANRSIKITTPTRIFEYIIGYDGEYYIPCWEIDCPINILTNEEYRISHGLSMRGTFPYHRTKEDLEKTIENLWYEQHAEYLVDYDVKMYSNIIQFTINDDIVYKFRIRLNNGGYCLNPTKGCMGELENNLFNHEALGLEQIQWKGIYPTKEKLLKFIFDYQKKARIYNSL